MSRSLIGGMLVSGKMLKSEQYAESIKESEDPESTRDFRVVSGRVS